MTILLVEPDKFLGEATKAALVAAGLKVVWRRNAQTALDAVDDQKPDLIILELQLGQHNGVELLYEIASYPEWQDIPSIVYTLNARAQDQAFATALEQLKVQTVLYKPHAATAELVKTVKNLVLV